jgi:hypothetical protein
MARTRLTDPPDLVRYSQPDIGGGSPKLIPKLKSPLDDFNERFELPRIHYKPTDGIDFFVENSLSVTANMSYTTVSTFTLPQGYEGVLKGIVNSTSGSVTPSDTRWQVLINNNPVTGWQDAFDRGCYRDANRVFLPVAVTIFLPAASILTLQVRNTTVTAVTAIGDLIGWYWIQKDVRYATLS